MDVGGTFTDGVLIREGHEPLAAKTPTQPHDPVAGLRACLDRLAQDAGTDRRGLLARTAKLAYGTTLATNLLVEGRTARTGFLTTRGFRDTLPIAGIGRERIGMDLTSSRPPSVVPRRLIHEVSERVDARGKELAPVRTEDVRTAIAALEAEGVEAVGICLLWSFRDPSHEEQVAELVRAHDGWFVTTSSEVAPLMGEYERSATTALNAGLGPPVRRHLAALEKDLNAEGLATPLLVMQSSGGVARVDDASRRPVTLLGSGPAGGVLASKLLADALGLRNLICTDMGGTTFDVSLITDGEFATRDRSVYAGQEAFIASLDITSIGAGGGSVGWIEGGARLKVGPRSAGAEPGPACYGRGGTEATVTDANLALGRINPDGLAGGRVRLDEDAATRALASLGAALGLGARETAEGMVAIVDAAMADAIRVRTVRAGLDPADYALVSFGGGGPLHAAALARELGIGRVIVPALAAVLSAYGIVASDIKHVLAISEARSLTDHREIAAGYARLEAEGRRLLAADGVAAGSTRLVRTAQIRFRGQLHAVDVAVPRGEIDEAFTAALAGAFVRQYERLFGLGTSSAGAGMEVTTLRVDAIGAVERPRPALAEARPHAAAMAGVSAVWHEGRLIDTARYVEPRPGARLAGPALVDGSGSTVWVPPGIEAQVDGFGDLVLEIA